MRDLGPTYRRSVESSTWREDSSRNEVRSLSPTRERAFSVFRARAQIVGAQTKIPG